MVKNASRDRKGTNRRVVAKVPRSLFSQSSEESADYVVKAFSMSAFGVSLGHLSALNSFIRNSVVREDWHIFCVHSLGTLAEPLNEEEEFWALWNPALMFDDRRWRPENWGSF
jgi:hypothetical protein